MSENLLRNWEACLNNGDLDGIVDLYSSNAVLWGTFSNIIRDSPALIREYFESLYSNQDLKVVFGVSNVRTLEDVEIHSGEYEFSYKDGEKVKCPARFSFVLNKDKDGQYKIIDHHSSIVP